MVHQNTLRSWEVKQAVWSFRHLFIPRPVVKFRGNYTKNLFQYKRAHFILIYHLLIEPRYHPLAVSTFLFIKLSVVFWWQGEGGWLILHRNWNSKPSSSCALIISLWAKVNENFDNTRHCRTLCFCFPKLLITTKLEADKRLSFLFFHKYT